MSAKCTYGGLGKSIVLGPLSHLRWPGGLKREMFVRNFIQFQDIEHFDYIIQYDIVVLLEVIINNTLFSF